MPDKYAETPPSRQIHPDADTLAGDSVWQVTVGERAAALGSSRIGTCGAPPFWNELAMAQEGRKRMSRRPAQSLAMAVGISAMSLTFVACSASDPELDTSDRPTRVEYSGPSIGAPNWTPGEGNCPSAQEQAFSFFVISQEATRRESGNPDGFGGDLGGLSGADAICQRVAEFVSPCQSDKTWRAFLSTTEEDAIDRIGQGPWYDRLGRLFGNDIADILHERPLNADTAIRDDFPNEFGVPNSNPDGTGEIDNHQILTGSGEDGRLFQGNTAGTNAWGGAEQGCLDSAGWTQEGATCSGWTTSQAVGCPRVGHSWPGFSGPHWISLFNEGGCLPGGTLAQTGGNDGTRRVGSAGGYGAWYCFAVTP